MKCLEWDPGEQRPEKSEEEAAPNPMEIQKRKLVEQEVGWKAGEADTQGQGGGRKCKRPEREVGGSWRRPFET